MDPFPALLIFIIAFILFLHYRTCRDKNKLHIEISELQYKICNKDSAIELLQDQAEDFKKRVDGLESYQSKSESLAAQVALYADKLSTANKQIGELNSRLLEQKTDHEIKVKEERKDAVATSRTILKGQLSEQLVPLLPDFPYQTGDCKFFGQPIDYIVFKGMAAGQVEEIIILDVKTGNAKLNKVQRQIRDCVEDGKVTFITLKPNLPEDTEIV
jgi:predicted Holliday junction resolvase-like endonuclease